VRAARPEGYQNFLGAPESEDVVSILGELASSTEGLWVTVLMRCWGKENAIEGGTLAKENSFLPLKPMQK